MFLKKEIIRKAGLILISILLSLFIAEILLRIVYPKQEKLFVWQPNLKHTFYPDSTIFYGINGASDFTINSQGFRGTEFKGAEVKFLCLGGSTTECLYLDNNETWFHQLEDSLNTKFKTWKFQLGSIGKSGCTTHENYIQLKYFVPQLGKVDGVILMVGINDLMKRLSRDTLFENDFRFNQQVEDSFVNAIFISNRSEKSWWRSLRLFQFGRSLLHKTRNVEWENVQDDKGEVYKAWRANRAHASEVIDSLPDLRSALNEFDRNLNLIHDETQKQGIKLILVNQSALYKDSMGAYENSLLWMGGKGNFQKEGSHIYYSTKALYNGLLLYNKHLKEFCEQNPYVKFIDIETELPRDTSVFYDDCHFNESGARKVASIISRQMLH